MRKLPVVLLALVGCSMLPFAANFKCPIPVDVSLLDQSALTDFRFAEGVWNGALGRPAFVDSVVPTAMLVRPAERLHNDNIIAFWSIMSLEIVYLASIDSGLQRRTVFVHELGHALNLKHSTSTESVMFPTVVQGAWPDTSDVAKANAWLDSWCGK